MKEVDIVSKIVNREGGTFVPSSKGTQPIDLSDYLLKSIWDKVFEIRTDSQGTEYIFGKLPMVTQYGITMYSGDGVDIPSLASGLPFDGRTIWYNPETNQIEVIGGAGGGSGEGVSNFWDLSGIPSWITNSKPKYTYSEIEGTPDLTKYALVSQIPSLSGYATESWVKNQGYLTQHQDLSGYQPLITSSNKLAYSLVSGTPTSLKNPNALSFGSKSYDGSAKITLTAGDLGALTSHQTIYTLTFASGTFASGSFIANSANKTINVPTTTSHISEGSNLYFTNTRAINALAETLKAYVTLGGTETITGEKNFTGGLKVNGSPIYYDTEKKYWKLEGDLLVTGGVTMYGSDSSFTPSTIMDAIVVDNVTIIKQDGKLVALGGGSSGGGLADAVAWGNILGKPSWITDTTPSISISGTSVSLGGSITQSALRNALGLGSNAYTSTAYLPLSGGTLSGNLTIQNTSVDIITLHRASNSGSPSIKFTNKSDGTLGYMGVSDSGRGLQPFFMDTGSSIFKIWHEGNDGSGSGLDADLLDGKQPSELNVGSATKLQTARTIWGQSFDGTGNVSGTLELGASSARWHNSNSYSISCPTTSVSARLQYHADDGHIFKTAANTDAITILRSGNVGIGTTSPSSKLHVLGDITASGILSSVGLFANDGTIILKNSANGSGLLVYPGIDESTSARFEIRTNNAWARTGFTLFTNGNFTIGTSNDQGYRFFVAGNAKVQGNILATGGITMYSMRKLKNVVDERGLSLSELSTIKPTRYTWKDGRDNRLHFGGIADDIQQVLPEVVYSTSDGILTMDYGNAAFAVASSLIKPVIDHEKRIAMLEEENKELRNEIERLKSA